MPFFTMIPSLIEGPTGQYELERGKPLPDLRHAAVQVSLAAQLYSRREYSLFSELTIGFDSVRYTPDLVIYPFETLDYTQVENLRTKPPLLCIEIISPPQTIGELTARSGVYLAHGVKSCWIVDPALQAITILQPGEPRRVVDSGIATDPATGLTVDLARVFV